MVKKYRAPGLVLLILFPSSASHVKFNSGALIRTAAYRITTPIILDEPCKVKKVYKK